MTTRPVRHTLLVLATFAALVIGGPAAAAVVATTTFQVTASVTPKCTISATNVTVGAYDPVTVNDTNPATGTGTVTVRCTKGTTYSVSLNDGANTNRRMKHATLAEYLSYELYSDSAHTAAWTTGTSTVAANRSAVVLTVYASVPGAQDVSIGSYTDTVTADVNL